MPMLSKVIKNPLALKRLKRFKEIKRAYYSLWILIALYGLSLCAELICNSDPLYVHFNGKSYFPILRFYPDDRFTGSGRQTRPDYWHIHQSSAFKKNPNNYMLFTLLPHGPLASIDQQDIQIADRVTVKLTRKPMVGTVNIRKDFTMTRAFRLGPFVGQDDRALNGQSAETYFDLSADIKKAIASRFDNAHAPPLSKVITGPGNEPVMISLSTFNKRRRPPKTVRLTIREFVTAGSNEQLSNRLEFNRSLDIDKATGPLSDEIWQLISDEEKEELRRMVALRFDDPVDRYNLSINGKVYLAEFIKEDVRFPFRPVKNHWMGLDGAGRDVLARILYGLRTSMTFGLLLVLISYVLGIIAGALQGYYGGLIDISGQRLIEIWSALPFLYIMILLGSVYGRSFMLLLICYGIFNWIGISYYMRAEFLRLRKLPFVEAAKCMGISSSKVIFRHILPNSLVPVITFFPFSLVGAIGALAALDYLGFGLPPPTPSWGELLFQAQEYRWAWWLILYPSTALFAVMLLGVFVGEGVRNAYDPKRYTRLE
jgi:microcin C transport system permease protein